MLNTQMLGTDPIKFKRFTFILQDSQMESEYGKHFARQKTFKLLVVLLIITVIGLLFRIICEFTNSSLLCEIFPIPLFGFISKIAVLITMYIICRFLPKYSTWSILLGIAFIFIFTLEFMIPYLSFEDLLLFEQR